MGICGKFMELLEIYIYIGVCIYIYINMLIIDIIWYYWADLLEKQKGTKAC